MQNGEWGMGSDWDLMDELEVNAVTHLIEEMPVPSHLAGALP